MSINRVDVRFFFFTFHNGILLHKIRYMDNVLNRTGRNGFVFVYSNVIFSWNKIIVLCCKFVVGGYVSFLIITQ